MKRFAIAAVLAAGVTGVCAQGATAATIDGPCETVRNLADKYNIELGMHQEEAEYALGQVCQITG